MKNEQSEHTPTPWILKVVDSIVGMEKRKSFQIVQPVTETVICSGLRVEEGELIVRAVNSHDDLVKIAQAYRNLLRTMAHTDGEVATFHHINEVLAKAEGGSL